MQDPARVSSDDDGVASGGARPLLVYDGECAFCRYWALYWRRLTGDRVEYRPYQEVAARFPEVAPDEFRRAAQFIAPDGRRASAAEASFLALSHAHARGLWLALYRHLPGFSAVSEAAYRFIAAHRPTFFRATLLIWGRRFEPPRYDLVSFLYLRLFGLIYLAAFVSFGVQAQGLIGSRGVLPLADWTRAAAEQLGADRFLLAPNLFWLNDSDAAIQLVAWSGAALSLLLFVNLLPRLSLALLYALYLSLFYAGQTFTSYQWDTFLLENGFVALTMSFSVTPGVWLSRWLLFRFMFMSGVVKLISGDPNWWNLSALSYHFLTQPLPTPLAWRAALLPPEALKAATTAVFFAELVAPLFIFAPRRLRFLAGLAILLLEGGILLTGNYNWFNLQTMLLCLPLFDDAAMRRVLPRRLVALLAPPEASPSRRPLQRAALLALSALIVFCGLVKMDLRFGGAPPAVAQAIDGLIEPLHIDNAYGLFAVMTTERNEIVIEGSDDGVEWRPYEFVYKPGELSRPPHWNIPHQPRLDWQMWFAALEDPRALPWFARFLERLLENEPTVTALLERNPFANKPPVFVRAEIYNYVYATAAERARGLWWERRLLGQYFPPVRLKSE